MTNWIDGVTTTVFMGMSVDNGAQYGQRPHCRHRTGRQQAVCIAKIRWKLVGAGHKKQ